MGKPVWILLLAAAGVMFWQTCDARSTGKELADSLRVAEDALTRSQQSVTIMRDSLKNNRVVMDSLVKSAKITLAHSDTVVHTRIVKVRESVPDSIKPIVDSLESEIAKRDSLHYAIQIAQESRISLLERTIAKQDSVSLAYERLNANLHRALNAANRNNLMSDAKIGAVAVIGGYILGKIF